MNANLLRRVNWLWKHRHTHDDDNFQEQITVIKATVETQGDVIAASGSGAYVHLERATSQSLGTVAEAIEWDRLNAAHTPLEFSVTPPVTEVEILKAGYYDIEVAFTLASSYRDGGSVRVLRNSTSVWPPSVDTAIWTTDKARRFAGVAKGVECEPGDTISVEVEHNSVLAVDLEWAQCSIELVDRRTGSTGGAALAGYRVEINGDHDGLRVVRRAGREFVTVGSVSKAHTFSTWYWMRARIDGQRIRAKTWSGTEGSEPAGWDLDITDTASVTPSSGWAGLAQISAAVVPAVRRCDVFEVTNDGGTPVRTDFSDHTPGALAGQGWTTVSQDTLTHTVEDGTGSTGGSWVSATPTDQPGHHFIGWSDQGVGGTQEVLARILSDAGSVGVLLRGNVE